MVGNLRHFGRLATFAIASRVVVVVVVLMVIVVVVVIVVRFVYTCIDTHWCMCILYYL